MSAKKIAPVVETTPATSAKTYPAGLPESTVILRKSRRIGSDDISNAALVAKYGDQAGLRGQEVQVAASIGGALDQAHDLALNGQFMEAAKKVASCGYVLKRNERVANLKVNCRDGRERKLSQVCQWFASVHFRVAEEYQKALDTEAKVASEKAAFRAQVQEKVAKIFSDHAAAKAA